MKTTRTLLLLALTLFGLVEGYAQQSRIIRGRVTDSGEKIAVIGANVIEYDKDNRIINGTISNVNGDFVLEMKSLDNILRISVIGYETKEIPADPGRVHSIELDPSNVELEEVTITAKSQSKFSLTNIDERDNASSTVKVDLIDMQDAGILSATDALQGKISGLDIISASGDPGSGSQLVIRGLSSMGNSQPLIVVDGVPQFRINRNDIDISSADTEDLGNLINVAIQDIKSIEILKDAASTAVWGSQGADGVLLIETHSGRLGKVQFDYQYKPSLNVQPPAIPMLDGDEYVMLQLEEWHNATGVFEIPPEIAYDKDYVDFYNYSANTDWLGEITQNARTDDHYFKVSGGGQKTRFFTSFSYVNQGGTTINTNGRRVSTRVNLDYYLSRKMVFMIQFNYTNTNNDRHVEFRQSGQRRNVRQMALIKAPNMSIWEYDEKGNPTGEYFTPINSYQGGGGWYFNPVAIANLDKNNHRENHLQNTFRLRYNLTDWLTLSETVSFQYKGYKDQNYIPYNALGTDWLAWTVNKAEESNNMESGIRTETQLSFDSPLRNENHSLTGAVTWITSQNRYEWMNIQSNKIPSTDITDPAIDGQINWIGTGSGERREIGALANLNYKYKDRYMIQTVLRADAASVFGSNNRWALFPGVSLGWRFSSEPFMQSFQFLDESMLRFSWGISGRQPGEAYAQFATYESTGNGNYMVYPAIVPQSVQLDNLKWESQSSFNIGLELNLFDYRVFIETDIYKKLTSDLLFDPYYIPRSSGYNELNFFNGGSLENRGWELMAEFKIIQGERFRWSVNVNTSQNVNSFMSLPANFNNERSTSIGNGQYPLRVLEGEPIGSFFGFRYLGVYPTDQDAIATDVNGNMIRDEAGNPLPMTYLGIYIFRGGDAKYEDINHDGKIDLNDVVYIGDSNPDFIGGFGTTMNYKNFDVGCSFHYRLGFDIVNQVAINTEGMNNRNNQSKAVLSRWRVQGQDEPGMLPRAYMNHPANNLGSDRYVEPGDYLRLINLKLGYRLRKDWCDRLKLRSVNLAFTARKILTFTRYSGQDPEVGQDATDPFWIGVDRANTPPPKVYTLSIAVGF